MATPIGSMKHTEATLMAIWCAATAVAPMRAISSAVTMNRLPSMKIATPIGRPMRSSSAIGARCGASKRPNSCRSRKRGDRRRYSRKPRHCSHSTMLVARPSPVAPIVGSGPTPNISAQPSGVSSTSPPTPNTMVGGVQARPSLR